MTTLQAICTYVHSRESCWLIFHCIMVVSPITGRNLIVSFWTFLQGDAQFSVMQGAASYMGPQSSTPR
ncbi:hypothetical protein BV22DRAFT_1033389 [Leucogyrophana mollusca]|uniref:Uncharacterized protein n=1 Tax=Leucogyrophana mollusca TaxID=85980 RepID=A0ACB8BMA8_9AGAM|nr:hypothetical protein BV22DRAFT_1033389 [Leucogyrophana mollusca]